MRNWAPFRRVMLATTALVPLGIVAAPANPLGPNVVGGGATVTGIGTSNVTINQSTPRAIINWNTFNIGLNETTRFNQPSSSSIALNRVTGGFGPSMINGMLEANGRVFLVNPDGVMISKNGQINTAGFLASTNDISNANFMAGRYQFDIPGRPSASIVNEGRINAHSHGFAALVAPGVRNSGTITASYGQVALASGNSFALDFYGDQLIKLAVNDSIKTAVIDVATGKPLSSLVSNTATGKLRANGGRVELTAAAARTVVNSVINNTGVIEARSVGTRNGKIVLGGSTTNVAGLPPQTVRVSGKLDVSSKKGTGGSIQVTGERIVIKAASFDASGATGGGKVLIGGDTGGGHGHWAVESIPQAVLETKALPNATTVTIDAATTINVSATSVGNAGKAIVWADGDTTFAGTILARGGTSGGNGGFVEVSGKQVLNYLGIADLRAPTGSSGTLLLDPYNVTINGRDANGSFDANGVWTPTGPGSTISVGTLLTQLGMGNVIITTNGGGTEPGDMTILSNITYGGSNSLTLRAHNDIFFDDAVVTFNGAGNLILRADSDGNGAGIVDFTAPALLDFANGTGRISIFYNSTSYSAPTNFSSNLSLNSSVSGQFTAFMLVNSATDLNNLGLNSMGNYALGRDIAVNGNIAGAPGVFSGIFDGLNHTVSNVTLTGPAIVGTIGSTGIVRNLKLENFNVPGNAERVGILAGTNDGLIDNVTVIGASSSVSNMWVGGSTGGLVGWNNGTIRHSSSSASVTSPAVSASVGGLVGTNWEFGVIRESSASGAVTATASVPPTDCTGSSSCPRVYAGGLVGMNNGDIVGYNGSFTTFATGPVTVGQNGVGGGLVGFNSYLGYIDNTKATGAVTGSSGLPGSSEEFKKATILGGLVGVNQGYITESRAENPVGSAGANYLMVGGFVGDNMGYIGDSSAIGNVLAGNFSEAGGFVGAAGMNDCVVCSVIAFSTANGSVTVGSSSIAGGFAASSGFIHDSHAAGGAVTGGGNSILGGFAGVHNIGDFIAYSSASGPVTATGPSTWAGGFIGYNGGAIWDSTASSTVTGTTTSILGGFAGVNIGWIDPSNASGAVTATGANNILGGFAGLNLGTIDNSASTGNVTGGANNIVGGFVGANATFVNFSPGIIPYSSFPGGTVNNSTATGNATGGSGSTTGAQIATTSPGTLTLPGVMQNCSDTMCQIFRDGVFANAVVDAIIPNQVLAPPTTQLLQFRTEPQPPNDALIKLTNLANLTTQQPGTTNRQTTGPSQVPGTPPASLAPPRPLRAVPGPDGEIRSNVPPLNETRFLANEVVLHLLATTTPASIQQIAQQLGLTLLTQQNLGSLGRTAYRLQIGGGRSVRDIIRALEANSIVAVAQPNYTYSLVQQVPAAIAPFTASRGDPAQYMMGKLHLNDAHRIASGNNIIVAVIDSEVDREHAELAGTISQRFDATDSESKAHSHGTAMAGAIVSRDRLLGIAPGAKILAVRAFSETSGTAESTSFNILKGMEWAISQGARVINMSFAGPYDPSLERTLKDAAAKGVILIGASGNAGPKSPPLWPGADPNVIAVTATDSGDKVFRQANRGPYVSVASPGVEILAPAPKAGYQLSTGTSIATAHVSGVVALMLERDPTLTPLDVRLILESTASDLGPKGRDTQFGWGLVNPAKAIAMVDERKRQRGTTSAPPPVQR